jgi:rSAM/selenodomain-associated transferase 1
VTGTLRPIVFARYPSPGRCKTRLIPALGAEGAARLHRRLVERTLLRLADLRPCLAYSGAEEARFREWLGGDLEMIAQASGDLGARMLAAGGEGPALIVGSDVPDISAAAVRSAGDGLAHSDLVLGPAADGGFWLIAYRRAKPALFTDVAWGTSRVHAAVLANAGRLGLKVSQGEMLADLDRPEDLAQWHDLDPR